MLYSFRNRQPRVGQGTYVSEQAILIGDVKIGDNCYIGHGAVLRGDYGSIEVGDGTAVEEGRWSILPRMKSAGSGRK